MMVFVTKTCSEII